MLNRLYYQLTIVAYLLTAVFCANCTGQRNILTVSSTPALTIPTPDQASLSSTPTTEAIIPASTLSETAVISAGNTPTAILSVDATESTEPICTPNSSWPIYTVQGGDTLHKISQWTNTTVDDLLKNNCLESRNLILVGQQLRVPQAVAPPTSNAPLAITTFELSSTVVERDSTLYLHWETENATAVTIWPLTYDSKTSSWYRIPADQTYQEIPPLSFSEPNGATSVPIVRHAQHPYRFELEATNAVGETAVVTSDIIQINCHASIASLTIGCPESAETAVAYYQPFEQGILLWLENTQEILLLPNNSGSYAPWRFFMPTVLLEPLPETPPNLLAPAPRFAGFWASSFVILGTESDIVSIGQLIGWATEPEQRYEAQFQTHWDNNYNGIADTVQLISLPNGRFISLVALEPYVKTGSSWQIISP